MNKTLRISFALKNTYRVNTILYAVKQIPLIKKALPDTLYQVRGLKIFANVLAVIWEIISAFLGKFLYFLLMIQAAAVLYPVKDTGTLFLHILLLLSFIGAVANTYMFNPSKDKYYALILLGMNSREYTLIHYFYSILKLVVGFGVFGVLFGKMAGLSLWICLLIPFFVAGIKLNMAAYTLHDYEKTGNVLNENKLTILIWVLVCLILAAAYVLPAIGVMIPIAVSVIIMVFTIFTGIFSLSKIRTFSYYQQVYHELLRDNTNQMSQARQIKLDTNRKLISADTGIVSDRKGFEYLNQLFMRRHKKILWQSSKRISFVCLILILSFLLIFQFQPQVKEAMNHVIMTFLPLFVFIMYIINRGTSFTTVLFMNCDHSLLTYSFYKQPKQILKLFKIRLKEIVKVNLLPAMVIGIGLAVLLYAAGGTDHFINYGVLIISIPCMSIFFSVHYLTVYYLLQPYNKGTEIKSGMYQVVMTGTYVVCYLMMKVKMSTQIFGTAMIVFCIIYCILACILVYLFAPKTFKLRN